MPFRKKKDNDPLAAILASISTLCPREAEIRSRVRKLRQDRKLVTQTDAQLMNEVQRSKEGKARNEKRREIVVKDIESAKKINEIALSLSGCQASSVGQETSARDITTKHENELLTTEEEHNESIANLREAAEAFLKEAETDLGTIDTHGKWYETRIDKGTKGHESLVREQGIIKAIEAKELEIAAISGITIEPEIEEKNED